MDRNAYGISPLFCRNTLPKYPKALLAPTQTPTNGQWDTNLNSLMKYNSYKMIEIKWAHTGATPRIEASCPETLL